MRWMSLEKTKRMRAEDNGGERKCNVLLWCRSACDGTRGEIARGLL
jgi:hypothetical protein